MRFLCGGNWNNGASAGVFNVNGNNARSNANWNIGFRAALPPMPDIQHLMGAVSVQEVIKGSVSSVGSAGRKKLAVYTGVPAIATA